MSTNLYNLTTKRCRLRAGDDGSNVAKSADQERNGLEEEVYKVVVLPMHIIIASTDEQKGPKSQLQEVKPVNI